MRNRSAGSEREEGVSQAEKGLVREKGNLTEAPPPLPKSGGREGLCRNRGGGL